MSSCRLCGATIRWAGPPDRRVPLDTHEVTRGEGRYVESDGELVAVRPDADVAAFQDHRRTCPHAPEVRVG